ncbi:N-6 DNA methylase (plasmid) [Streptomyces sp. Qhu-G9]|uniref:HsdM family class I SAM-dependent methyltransferase n=1 Tax=Streptomyces sp. Qhu-G9 TaxID=3452799 RepID=UPI0022AC62FB|nr:N-6 DNA methylase [Streptomyces aurantiacus]WAU78316.1 N-6 DNA methylase [Streptomyces aurantiacus]
MLGPSVLCRANSPDHVGATVQVVACRPRLAHKGIATWTDAALFVGVNESVAHSDQCRLLGRSARADFVTGSIDKQVNFLQHVMSLTARPGRAAIVVPDNILFATGAAETVRRHLLEHFDVHTVLRLPAGIFYSGGVRANVVFFDRPSHRTDDRPRTAKVWVYDLRSGRQFAPDHAPLLRTDLDDFVSAYLPGRPRTDRVETDHFRCFDVQDVLDQDQARLDLTWSPEPTGVGRPAPPEEIARDVVHDLRMALKEFEELAAELRDETD